MPSTFIINNTEVTVTVTSTNISISSRTGGQLLDSSASKSLSSNAGITVVLRASA